MGSSDVAYPELYLGQKPMGVDPGDKHSLLNWIVWESGFGDFS